MFSYVEDDQHIKLIALFKSGILSEVYQNWTWKNCEWKWSQVVLTFSFWRVNLYFITCTDVARDEGDMT
jgi:hypothetical protein